MAVGSAAPEFGLAVAAMKCARRAVGVVATEAIPGEVASPTEPTNKAAAKIMRQFLLQRLLQSSKDILSQLTKL